MVHATSVTTTTGVLSCAAHSALTHGHVASHTSSLLQPCYLYTNERKSVSAPIFAETALTHLPFLFADRFNNNHA